jgi:mannosyltransferase
MAAFGTGAVVVRLLSVVLTAVALALAHVVGGRLARLSDGVDARAGGRAAVIALAALPWTMRFGSETRMYVLVVVLVLCGVLALEAVHRSASRRAVVALAVVVAALLLTHYWSLFLLAAVGLLHLPALLRRRPAAVRVAVAGLLGALAFLPWLPTLLFQAAHTGAPWARPVVLDELIFAVWLWGGGSAQERGALAVLLLVLIAVAVVRSVPAGLPARLLTAVTVLTLVLAWLSVVTGGGAFAARYTAVVVPLAALAAALGALALPGREPPLLALAALLVVGVATGVPHAAFPRTPAGDIVEAYRETAAPGDLLVSCPDQLAPPVARLLGDGPRQVVYPSLGDPRLIDWVDYADRQDAADPVEVAAQVDALAGQGAVYLLRARGYRTFEGDCEELFRALRALRGEASVPYGVPAAVRQVLYRFD